jgi:hypothetical protein
MRENEETHARQVTLKHVHNNALLVKDDEGEEVWIPFSQIHDDSEIWEDSKKGEKGKIVVSEWIAKKVGWLE